MTIAPASALLAVLICAAMAAAAGPLPFTTVVRGSASQIDERREVVVRTAAEWRKLWNDHAPGSAVPEVDFARDMVLGVFLGTRPTGGYAVEIMAVEESGGRLTVRFREGKPGPRDMVSQALTSPLHLVTVKAHSGEVAFVAVAGPAR